MPRLGGNAGDNTPTRRKTPSLSMSMQRLPKLNLRNVLLVLAALFILRNFFRNDYRQEELQYLRNSGMSDAEIDRTIPKTPGEQEKYAQDTTNDLGRMKSDIAYLLKEVHDLKMKGKTGHAMGDRDAGLKEMDHIHEAKRKAREEKLLKEHPDFQPSPRINRAEK